MIEINQNNQKLSDNAQAYLAYCTDYKTDYTMVQMVQGNCQPNSSQFNPFHSNPLQSLGEHFSPEFYAAVALTARHLAREYLPYIHHNVLDWDKTKASLEVIAGNGFTIGYLEGAIQPFMFANDNNHTSLHQASVKYIAEVSAASDAVLSINHAQLNRMKSLDYGALVFEPLAKSFSDVLYNLSAYLKEDRAHEKEKLNSNFRKAKNVSKTAQESLILNLIFDSIVIGHEQGRHVRQQYYAQRDALIAKRNAQEQNPEPSNE